jgi:hypothetical protein
MAEFDDALNGLLKDAGAEGDKLKKEIQSSFTDIRKQTQERLLREAETIKTAIIRRQTDPEYDNDDLQMVFDTSKPVLVGIAADAEVKGQMALKSTIDNFIAVCLDKLLALLVKLAGLSITTFMKTTKLCPQRGPALAQRNRHNRIHERLS